MMLKQDICTVCVRKDYKKFIKKIIVLKVILPVAIGLLSIAIIIASLTSVGMIKGASDVKKPKKILSDIVTVTSTPSPTPASLNISSPTAIKNATPTYPQATTPVIQPTSVPTVAVLGTNNTTSEQPVESSSDNTSESTYEVPKDSQGIACWSNTSHCKYECKDPDGWIDVWVDNIKFYIDRSNFTSDEVKLQEYKNEINDRVAKLVNSCGEEKVRQWVQL